MINNFTIKAVALSGLMLFVSDFVFSQTDAEKGIKQLKVLLKTKVEDKSPFVTNYMLDSLMLEHQKSLSGSQIEAGKSFGSSLALTDKGATVNVAFRNFGKIFPQFHISGTGKDNFVNLLEKGKYGNTLSSGLNFNIFGWGSGKYGMVNKRILRKKLEIVDALAYDAITDSIMKNDAFIKERAGIQVKVKRLSQNLDAYLSSWDAETISPAQIDSLPKFIKIAEEFIKCGLLPKDFLEMGINGGNPLSEADNNKNIEVVKLRAKIRKLVLDLENEWKDISQVKPKSSQDKYRQKLYLDSAEVIQMGAKWNSLRYHWFTVAADINVSPYNVLNPTAADSSYSKVYNDYFFAASISYNMLNSRLFGSQWRLYLSPTFKFQNARQYDSDDKITLHRFSPYPIGADSLVQQKKTYEVYPSVADRKWTWSFEVPVVFYSAKKNWGIELAPKGGVNDINGDNFGFRLGIFIPMEVKEGVPLVIEPIFRLQKLFDNKEEDFLKNNVVVGFNVSVSLPKALGKIGKQKPD